MGARDRMTVAGAVAVLLACSSLLPVFDSTGWLLRTAAAVAAVALASASARRAGVPAALQPLVGLLALLAYVVVVFAGATLHHVVLPGSETVTALRALLETAAADVEGYAPPVPANEGFVLLVVLGAGAVMVLVDAAAVVAGRAALAGLPLLLLFAVPSAVLTGGLGWWPFVLGGAGWLGLLVVEGRERVGRWGTPLQTSTGRSAVDPIGTGRVGRRIGAAALGVAVVVPALLPGLDARLLDGGVGGSGGDGDGSRTITTYNPITRLQGQLTLREPVEVLRYTTDDPEPDYLRMTTLGIYDGEGWRQDVLNGNLREDGVGDPLPTAVGRNVSTRTRLVQAQIDIATLDAFWLPSPITPSEVEVEGPWLWDERSESVFATRSDTTEVEPYTVTASRVLVDPSDLGRGDGVPGEVEPYASDVEAADEVVELTNRVVAGATTDYERAAALQSFFRDPAERFRYSLRTDGGGDPDALRAFLDDRAGYCQQYASAMAAMLRIARVPSRVAVGFTPGTRQADGSYVVTTRNAHAWPEAWFEGAGWIRFEPTPSDNTVGIEEPGYVAAPVVPADPAATAPDAPGAAPAPSTNDAETLDERRERLAAEAQARAEAGGDASTSAEQGPPVRELGVVAGVLLLLAAPALLHAARRRHRWRTSTPGTAWDQVRDDSGDVGHRWDEADSPRSAAARLVREQRLDASSAGAVGRLAAAVERSRYAPAAAAGLVVDGLREDSVLARRGLHAGRSRSARTRVLLLPPSTLRWASSTAGTGIADLLDLVDGAFARVVRRLRRLVRRPA